MHTYSHNPIFHLFCFFFLLLLGPTLSNSRNVIHLPQSRPSAHHNSNLTQYHHQLINLFEEEENDTNTTNLITNTTPTSLNPFTLQDYVLMLKQNSFFGTWSSLDSVSRPFEEFFTNPAGLLIIEALDSDKTQVGGYSAHMVRNFNVTTNLFTGLRHFSAAQSYSNDYNTWTLLIKMYDGAYVDQNSANVFYQVTPNTPISFDSSNTTLFISDSTINVYLKDGNGDGRLYRQCAANFSLYIADKSSLQPFLQADKGNSNVGLFFELTSSECNISVGSGIMTIDGFADSYQINLYTLVASTIALIQIIGAYKLRCQIRNRKMAFRVAAGSIWLIATVDYYMLIMNLVLIFSYSLKFTVPLLLYVILTFYIERDIIVQVLKAQSKRSELEISDENCRSCGFHFGLSTLMFVFELIFILMSKLWVIHFTALVFIPQIVYNAKKARPYVFNFYQVFLMGVPHIAFIAYLKLYPDNIFRLHPDMTFVIIYASIIGVQILILIAQTVTPLACLFCLSKKRKKSRVLEEDDVCPICMGDLKVDGSRTAADSALLDCEETIETPCSHVFHTECLRKWLKNKVECPVCRENVEELLEEVTVSSEEDGQRQIPEPELGPLML